MFFHSNNRFVNIPENRNDLNRFAVYKYLYSVYHSNDGFILKTLKFIVSFLRLIINSCCCFV